MESTEKSLEYEFSRTELLLGRTSLEKLKNSNVAVFGVGGVGSYVVEALARSAVGNFTLFDADTVSISNINRQLIATQDTIGQKKVKTAKRRILSINQKANVNISDVFYLPENADDFDLSGFDYIIDAVDTVTAKIEIIMRAEKVNVPVISSMGTGNKLSPTLLEVTDIYKTSVCPLAKVMRHELKKRGIESLKVVYSKETPIKPKANNSERKVSPGSVSFVPSVAGLIIASEVVKDIIGINN